MSFKVSVVVPIYNVQEYLRACLDSVVAQTIDSLQVILIDDGSTDNSSLIADEYAAKYDSFTCYHIENQGLGHARNYGVRFAEGEYICFLDSDDLIPPYAYEKMYELAQRHQCDLVVGDVVRFNSSKQYPSDLHLRAFRNAPEIMHISRNPSLFNDTTAWNKLFRKTFYDKHEFKWAEGMLYEDIPVTVPAHVLANRVGYLNQVVYKWRARDGASSSITQRRKELSNFRDRLKAIRMVDDFFNSHVFEESLHIQKDFKWLDMDFKLYFPMIPLVDERYREYFLTELSRYLTVVKAEAFDMLRAIDRIAYHFIKEKDVKSFLDSLTYAKRGYKSIGIKKESDGEYVGLFPFGGLDRNLRIMTPELKNRDLYAKIHGLSFDGASLNIDGEACIPRLPVPRKRSVDMKFELVNTNNEPVEVLTTDVVASTSPYSVRLSRTYRKLEIENQKYRAFRSNLNLSGIGRLEQGTYYVRLVYTLDGMSCAPVRLGNPGRGDSTRPMSIMIDDRVVSISYNAAMELCFQVRKAHPRVRDFSITPNGQLEVGLSTGVMYLDIPSKKADPSWHGYANLGQPDYVPEKPQFCSLHDRLHFARIDASNSGEMISDVFDCAPVAVETFWRDSCIVWKLNCNFVDVAAIDGFLLVGDVHGVELRLSHQFVQGDIFVELDLLSREVKGSLRADSYRIVARTSSPEGDSADAIVLNGLSRSAGHPSVSLEGYIYRCISDDQLRLEVSSLDPWYEDSKLKKKIIELFVYPVFRLLPIKKNLVVFESSWGAKTDCNPGALYDYIRLNHPHYQCVWSLNDTRTDLRGNARRVKRGSLAYFLAMARARYLINNVNFSDSYVKRSGQIEIQTMHGTPLKTLGLDVPGELETKEARDRFLRRRARWDYLVVQSPAAKRITASCYAFEKTFLETGYPRNDSLFRRNTPEEISIIKRALGLPLDKKIILYAPTWRVRNAFDLKLDISRMQEMLGDEYAVALRVHQFALPGLDVDALPAGLYNVSSVKSMEDLLLVSDILITDYSSVMFDYALLKRPILFYTYDLEEYRDSLRGFNIDLEKEAPGPLLSSTEEIIDAIANIERTTETYQGNFDRFYSEYCSYEEGDASEKIFKTVFSR